MFVVMVCCFQCLSVPYNPTSPFTRRLWTHCWHDCAKSSWWIQTHVQKPFFLYAVRLYPATNTLVLWKWNEGVLNYTLHVKNSVFTLWTFCLQNELSKTQEPLQQPANVSLSLLLWVKPVVCRPAEQKISVSWQVSAIACGYLVCNYFGQECMDIWVPSGGLLGMLGCCQKALSSDFLSIW